MPATATRNLYRLVCLNWDELTDVPRRLEALRTRFAAALISDEKDTVEVPTLSGGQRTVARYTFTLDGSMLRNTHAHDIGYRQGFIVHTETVPAPH